MNDTRLWVADLLSAFSGQENTLTIPRPYITITGSIEAALLLSQIIYWSDRTKMDDGWFAKSYKDWQEEITLTKRQVSRAIPLLESLGVETKVKRFNGSPTLHYRINRDKFSQSIVTFHDSGKLQNVTIEDDKTEQSLTEPIPEPTPDIIAPKVAKSELNSQFDSISTIWNIHAGGWVSNMQGMIFGTKKVKGEWLKCQFEPPATLTEVQEFEPYLKKRMADKNIKDVPTAAVTIQRWFYDYREMQKKATQPRSWADIPELRGITEIIT